MISLIAAIGKNNELGKNNKLLWNLPADMRYFRDTTRGHTVIMGRKTYEAIGKALPNRKNIVITGDRSFIKNDAHIVYSLEEALDQSASDGEVFIIGGAQIYAQALPHADTLYITHVDGDFDADTFFPVIDTLSWKKESEKVQLKDEENNYSCTFTVYKKNQ